MNLSVLERMVKDGDMSADALRYLLDCRGECEWLDYKEDLHLDSDEQQCAFGRDVVAFKNVGGGYIVVGVEDKTWKQVGIPAPLAYDSKLLRDKVRRATGTDIDIDIVQHTLTNASATQPYALILVRGSRRRKKRRTPTVIEKDFCASRPFGVRRGEIYVRRGDSTVRVASREELADLLEALEEQADQDALVVSASSSPFAVEDGTYRLLEKGYQYFIGRDKLRQDVLAAVTKDPRIWIINVHGPGGVGKSALVNWAVYEFYRERTFEAILHLTAKESVLTPQGIARFSRSLYSLENLIDHILDTFQENRAAELEEKKKLVLELLSVWKTLLVLDNMETVGDGRILPFIQGLPPETKTKVLLTSRQRSGGWELPLPVSELDGPEVRDFIMVKGAEMRVNIPNDPLTVERIRQASGGLPLAIQWILGRVKLAGALEPAILAVGGKDSPILEFSFGNIWSRLSGDAKSVLAVMSIFEEPPTVQQLLIATQFATDRIDKALGELAEVTLVTKHTQVSDGTVRFIALPITLSFARHQLAAMGEFEVNCRQRFQKFNEQMRLQEFEVLRFRERFERFGLETDNEKRAAILCQRGQSEMFAGNVDAADVLFKQASDLAPQSSYVHAMCATYHLTQQRVGLALDEANEACRRANQKTGSLCYAVKAQVLDVQRDRSGRVDALKKALEYDPNDALTRHQYGVALSRAGRTEEAIQQFTDIIEEEKSKSPPSLELLIPLKTRMINFDRLGKHEELRKDLEWARQILADNPHLASQAPEFSEFDRGTET